MREQLYADLYTDQQAIETLLRLAEEYTGHTKQFTGQGASTIKGAHGDNSIQAAEADLKVRSLQICA